MSDIKNKFISSKRGAVLYENRFVLLASLIAFAVTQLVAFCYDLIPYGDMTILRMDLYHQYGPLFAELYDRIASGSSLIYSWNSGLGSSFLGNFFNYLSSPLSILVIFFGHKNITEAISFLIMLKAVLSSGTFAYYIKKSYNHNSVFISGFGILYAFCGYFVAYYWNLMWLDAMVLFPIIMLGIEKIIKEGKPQLYCISLAVMMFANYYMAYMVCIFSVLYFFAFYFSEFDITKKFDNRLDTKNAFKKLHNSVFYMSTKKFALYSLTAALLASIAIVPLISILSESSATSSSSPTGFTKYFTAFDFLANHLAGPTVTIRSSGDTVLPNVYCGILTVMLVPLYLFSKKITLRKKVCSIILLTLLYFSFSVNYLNYFWHGFHFPNDLPYRFSFMYCFIMLKIAFEALINIKEYSARQILAAGTGIVFFLVLVEKFTQKNVDNTVLGLSLIYTVGYVIVLYLFNNKKFQSSAVAVLLVCCISSEVALSSTNNYTMNQSKPNYTSDYAQFRHAKSELDKIDPSFYRMERTDLRTRMDPCWFNYRGVSAFSSMAYESVANLAQEVGLYGNYINSYTYNPQTPVFNTFFALKYIVDNTGDDLSCNYYTKIIGDNQFTVYENNYYLPVAFCVNNGAKDWNSNLFTNPFTAQSELFRLSTGIDNVFTPLEVENTSYSNINEFYDDEFENGEFRFTKTEKGEIGSVCFEITPDRTDNVYIYIKAPNIETVEVSSVMYSKAFNNFDEPYILDLGQMNAGETIYVDIAIKDSSNTGALNFHACMLNRENFEQGYNSLKAGQFNIDNFSDTYLVGSINAETDSVVYTSIPYDPDWHIYIDGQPASKDDMFKISNALLGFNIPAGNHRVTLQYKSSGFILGAFITAITVIIATLIIVLRRRKQRPDLWAQLYAAPEIPEAETSFVEFTESGTVKQYSPPDIKNVTEE
ncbi:MAG: hypothetical protein E7514_04700 [Ruminococcaceae bacterium]|nr:hypothetical protein [Oscillospiraceae bacterium]